MGYVTGIPNSITLYLPTNSDSDKTTETFTMPNYSSGRTSSPEGGPVLSLAIANFGTFGAAILSKTATVAVTNRPGVEERRYKGPFIIDRCIATLR